MGRIMMMAHSLRNYGTDYFERMHGIERVTEVQSALPAFDLSMYRRQKQTQVPSQVNKNLVTSTNWSCTVSGFFHDDTVRSGPELEKYFYLKSSTSKNKNGKINPTFLPMNMELYQAMGLVSQLDFH